MWDIVSGPDGTIWFLNYSPRRIKFEGWWVSSLTPNGEWSHFDLGQLTGLEFPRSRDAMAIDGFGRLWFTALSAPPREKYLGVLNPDGTLAHPISSLGQISLLGSYYYFGGGYLPDDPYGLVSDGEGGIYVYNGRSVPLRHWRP